MPSQWLSALRLCLPSPVCDWCAQPCRFVLVCFCVPFVPTASLCFALRFGLDREGVVELLCLLAAYSASRAWSALAWNFFFLPLAGMLPGKSEGKVLQLSFATSPLPQPGLHPGGRVRGGTHGLSASVPHCPPQVYHKWWGGHRPQVKPWTQCE